VEDIELYRNISVRAARVQRFEGSIAFLGSSSAYVDTQSGMPVATIKVSSLDYQLTRQRYTTALQYVGSHK
jgi:hypothetical protein